MTGDPTEVLPVLAAEIASKEKGRRRAAAAALGKLAGDAKAATLLGSLIADRDAHVRREAAASLAEGGGARAALERGLRDDDAGVRWWCAVALAAHGDVRKLEEEVLRALRRPLFRPGDDDAAQKLTLDVQAPGVAVAPLLHILRTKPVRYQYEAARALGQFGLVTRAALPEVLAALKTEDKLLRRAVAEALVPLGAEAMPSLAKLLGDADPRSREGAARALGGMGVAARSALPALEQMLKDPDAAARTQAALSLWSIDQNAEAALPVANLVLKDVDTADRWEAIEAVGIIGAEARPPIRGLFEVLANALKDRDPRVRVQAARHLWRRERQAKVIVPLLRDAVADRDPLVRAVAVETLGELGADESALPLLALALEDRDAGVRLLAEEGLARGGVGSVPSLLESLGAKSRRVRLGAVRALGLIGPAAKGARGGLEKLTAGPDAALQLAAREALRAIGPANP
ncbi:MAG: HEAT repeat domain-containing protein [Gemmataceae bacterium]